MNGRPVWLASASLRDSFGNIIPSARWSGDDRALLESMLLRALDGVGDQRFERMFRMPVTACIHRQLTAEEEAGLPQRWHELQPIHMAGGPLEILRETVPGAPSTRPCAAPVRQRVPGNRDPDLFLINDCGECETCLARIASEAEDRRQPLEVKR
jgi:hypothetical protein